MKNKKGNKRGKSDQIYAKKTKVIAKRENPFELHVNREKFNVLDRKTHHSFGKPLISRQKAFDRRKETIGAEYKVKNKSNSFNDNRKSGFQSKLPKESIYNLNDSEVLTHRGQTLAEIEQFDDAAPEEEYMSDEETRLDAEFTKTAHFGGGSANDARDRKTVIDELIADSKKRKAERMKEHEEMLDLTQKLDNDWKNLISIVKTMERTETPDKPEPDEYDRLVKEMIFSPRGGPAEKLKSEEDMARIEKEKLDKLERERLNRMKDEDDVGVRNSNYRSADDLDDGYFLEPVTDENDDDKVLSYPINPENEEGEIENDNEENYYEESQNDLEKNNNDYANDEENQEAEGEDEKDEEEEDDDDDDDESAEEEESEESDDLEDLKASESESDDEESEDETNQSKSIEKEAINNIKKPIEPIDTIPFTIQLPESYEELLELLGNHSIKIQATIIDRIIKTNHPKLHHSNKNKILKLFTYLLQYINDLFSDYNESNISKHFKLMNQLSPHIYDIIQMTPFECSESFLEVIKEKYDEYKKNPKSFPKLDTLIFFKIISALFPTSDFRHPIVTPCYIFLHHIFSQAKVKNRADVASGLFLVTLVHDYQKISKRFLPSALNFLNGICHMGIKKSMLVKARPIPPFKKMDELLVLQEEKVEKDYTIGSLKSTDFFESPIDDDFRIRALNLSCNLMIDFVKLYEEEMGVKYLITSFENVLKRLTDNELPSQLKSNVENILKEFEKIQDEKKFKYPEPEKKILPMLRMLEPRFETVLSDRRSMYCQASGDTAEKKKLQHMVKREMKSAKRELRRDNEYLSKIKHKRRQQMDVERKEKVKRIFIEGSMQQSEYKALSRTKGRKGIF